jgi:phosphatidylserine decarboxylase
VKSGDRMGFIMFGSRTDIIFPTVFDVKVKEGQRVIGGETIIAEAK